ncbi:MAG TPA: pitrilysin family protein [Thermomonas sp.]|nr:insulinase family protein [Thermomonas sp.]HQX94090.1 pitrilysin family protein [Thermomonas sp.]HQY82924.1 pitrilysin family protein [Thermomonas sp.]
MSLFRPAALALALATALSAGAYVAPLQAANAPSVDIPHDSFTLPNGLRVVVHTDRKAPVVAVNIWYHVGSKDEPSGRSGFAHLFEHLMFNGSENNPGEFFAPFKQVGVTDQNGTTNTDRTNYFQNVPTTALDMALWMESDRMGHLLGAVDQATLDEQRGVVQNEKRQGMNQPYGQLREVTTYTLYPKGHPYHHSVIGSMNDLNAAKLADVQAWFKTWYGPNNAVLVLAGDIDLATAREKVTRYFGHIPASPTMAQPKVDVAVLEQDGRTVLEDKVPQVMVRRMWNVPQTGTRDADMLDLFSDVLGGSASSRLDRRLVHQDKLVDSIGTANWASQLGGNFMVNAMVKQGVDPAKVEAAIDEELKKLIAEGPTAEELARAKTSYEAGFVRGVERIGGFGGKADVLASCAIYERNPGCFRDSLQAVAGATPAQVRDAAAKWLGKPSHVFMVKPGARKELAEAPAGTPSPFVLPKVDARYKTTASSVDRSKGVPVTASFPDLKFPAQQRATLSNGTTVILAERHDVPVVQMSYQFAGGYSADPAGKPGIANFTASLLDEGAGDLDALGFAARKEALGAQLGAGASLDGNNAILSALKKHLEPSVALFADMLRKPRFDQAQVDRVKGEWIASIRQEKAQPSGVALRVLPALMYGAGHPYGNPLSGTGTEAAIAALTRDDLVAFHQRMMQPAGATLVVVGDTTLAEIVPLLEKHLGSWKVGSAGGAPAIPAVANARQSRVFLIDQPGAVQANIFAAQLVPSSKDPGAIAFDMANQVFGGDFTARLNMNLREDKHWSYGARSGAASAVGQRMWRATAPVQIDKAGESVAEIRREIAEFFGGSRGTSAEELARQQKGLTLSLPGAYETAGSVLATIGSNVLYGRPDDYVFRRKAEIEAITPAQVDAAAKTLDPGAITWVVVGDLAKTEAPIRALKLGEVTILDAEGKPVSK